MEIRYQPQNPVRYRPKIALIGCGVGLVLLLSRGH